MESILSSASIQELRHASLKLLEVNLAITIDIALLYELIPNFLININIVHL